MKTIPIILYLMVLGNAFANGKPKEINIELKSVGYSVRDTFQYISFRLEYTNLTKNKVIMFPTEYGKLLGIFTPIFISGKDTIRVYQKSDVDYFCYTGDTVPPLGKIQQELDVWRSRRTLYGGNKLKSTNELFSLPLEKAAVEYSLNEDFDTIGLKEKNREVRESLSEYRKCGRYVKAKILTEFCEIKK